MPDRRILCAVADKIAPPIGMETRYVWKAHHGRPRQAMASDDLVQAALNIGNLPFIARQLRTSSNLDPRILPWIADQMDPVPGRSHFEVKRRPGAKCKNAAGPLFSNDIQKMLLGSKIARNYQIHGKLEAALEEAVADRGSGKAGKQISRSTARRAYDYYLKRTAFVKNRRV
jgi:hypothetical protein